jgi:uncharacterized protein YcbK (DUF882 family)
MMSDRWPHFTRAEFACKDGCGADLVHPRLLDHLEELRQFLQRPVPIVSGVRCCPHNAAVGGAKRSQHVHGLAADIPRDLGVTVKQAKMNGFTGIGVRAGIVVHVDVRATREAQVWTY